MFPDSPKRGLLHFTEFPRIINGPSLSRMLDSLLYAKDGPDNEGLVPTSFATVDGKHLELIVHGVERLHDSTIRVKGRIVGTIATVEFVYDYLTKQGTGKS